MIVVVIVTELLRVLFERYKRGSLVSRTEGISLAIVKSKDRLYRNFTVLPQVGIAAVHFRYENGVSGCRRSPHFAKGQGNVESKGVPS